MERQKDPFLVRHGFLMFSYSFYGLHDNPIFTGGNDATIESEQSEPQSKATVGNAVGARRLLLRLLVFVLVGFVSKMVLSLLVMSVIAS